MPNPMFENRNMPTGPANPGNPFEMLAQVKRDMGGNPQALYDKMYAENPQFRDFANSMRGKSPEEAFKERGLDFGLISKFFG